MIQNRQVCDKCSLFRKLQMYGFAMYDTALFLDTHPNDNSALEYYNRVRNAYLDSVMQYEEKYGPLTLDGVDTSDEWKWLSAPWPWQYEGN